jgi:uncharacterized membrane protein YfcA
MCCETRALHIDVNIEDDMDTTTTFILLVVFIATLIRSTFGFGESLIAVTLLIIFIPILIAVPFYLLI